MGENDAKPSSLLPTAIQSSTLFSINVWVTHFKKRIPSSLFLLQLCAYHHGKLCVITKRCCFWNSPFQRGTGWIGRGRSDLRRKNDYPIQDHRSTFAYVSILVICGVS